MAATGLITMSMHEIDRLKVIQAVVDGHLKPMQAAIRLGLTTRQVQRLVNRYREDGAPGLVSQKRGRTGNRQLAPGLGNQILTLIRDHYPDFGPTLANEKLREADGLVVSTETVRRLMIDTGLWIPRRQRSAKIYQPRNRRNCVGELIQIDGSDHRWFEERGPACTLLVYIDDATSRLMHLHFTYSESTFSYFEATRRYLELHGKPQAFYSDKASVFRVNHVQAVGGDGHTQFGRVLYELNIDGICANSSQAKGRVERANLTLQDRLVKEMRLLGISTMAAGNAYAPCFMADFNRRFAKPPRNDFDAHRAVRDDENLELIFTVREPRRVTHSLTLQYDKNLYLLTDTPDARAVIGKYVEVYEYPDGRIEVRANGSALPYTIYDRLSDVDQGAVVENKRLGHILQVAQLVQEQRDSRRGRSAPARTNQGLASVKLKAALGKKSQRTLNADDLALAIVKTNAKRVVGRSEE
jgi:transposase